ncbi:proto-oncogene tyrosine-protein kinase ROS isoform X2 [Macrosteles quadrilineatus]|uniref:proto-oncogene tyrosine-protein kinase ROS isoform X2 n=1 Tax=Macrosteles quadrilineatus TaxID=74068 RepID=UPI0023E14582|nr:proto-oncogene tyrosine-protein kinase ROS isoform X2 [Macrosteles quadrilineatus]
MRLLVGYWTFLVIYVVFTSAFIVPNFESQCETRCPLQNQTDDGHGDVGCGPDCKIQQCSRGCELWQKALESSCQVVCNGTQELVPLKELYCVMGCNDAVNRYFHELKERIGTLPPPALVADSLTATSLSLEWDGPRLPNISYLVQWRYEEIADTWQYCRNQSWGPHATVRVDNLQPYTKYRFRIALLLSPHHTEPIVSEPSLVISTLPGGAPASPPAIDIPASENKDFYMFQNLMPSRNYSVSVSMRNAAGLGPVATAFVTTPAFAEVKETQQLILIMGARNTVISQAADLLDDPVVMYKTTHHIKGVAVHVRKELLFVSDSSSTVWVSSSRSYTTPEPLLRGGSGGLIPHHLSVDWLNDQLYILAQSKGSALWQVVRCNLDGSGLTVAVAGFVTKPHHMEVDPYNGYLFWVVQGPVGGGLYRLDLADISNGVKHEVIPDQILASPHLGAFTVDHTSFRILVPNQAENTVVAVSLDGHEVTDIRSNTQQPQFHNVISLAMANGLFYWTNGERVLTEEYHAGQDSYFHNLVYTDEAKPAFVSITVNLPSSQPIPVPVNPPTGVQAVLGSHTAKVSWTVPHLLGGQGKGAWQNWSYQLSIRNTAEELVNAEELDWREINSTYYTVHDLKPKAEYVVKAAAYTSAGIGPWSSEFRGKTLRQTSEANAPSILWSAAEGLLRSDVTGERVETLIHRDTLKDRNGYHHITDIAWYRDQLYLVSNTSHVHWYNVTSHKRGRLRDLESVGSIAVDWVGRKLYWSNPKQQLIIRGNLNGSQQEPLPILTVAKELNVDAVEGFIYWSTGHAVESARLNGKHKKTYYPAELFSGKQVMGLTIDMDTRSVFWIVRSYEGSSLFRAATADRLKHGEEIEPQKVSSLQYPNMQGPLCYFDNHLVWLRDDRYAVIGDMQGQNSAVLSGLSLSELNMVTIMDHALHYAPRGRKLSEVSVIPQPISQQSLRVEGGFEEFTILWDPVTNVNYGQVFYEIKIRNLNKKDITRETTEPFWVYESPSELVPYSPLFVSVRALTYWGASSSARALLHSPPSIPSPPTNPRVFVSYNRNPVKENREIIAVFRWDSPVSPNGVVVKYQVKCWLDGSDFQVCDNTELPASTLEYVVPNLPQNTTIYFKAAACTEVGCGSFTPPVFGDSGIETPVPRLLLSTGDAVQITDCDKRENQTLSRSGAVVDLAYSSHDDRVYWIDDNNHLVTSRLYTPEKTKLLSLNNTGLSLAVDWVGRFLYWAERSYNSRASVIHSLDLNTERPTQRVVLSRPAPVVKLQVHPLTSMLYWVEERLHGIGSLMRSRTDGSEIRPFFPTSLTVSRWTRNACNCPDAPDVGAAIAIDQSEPDSPQLLFVDAWTNHIVASDMDGCSCNMLVNTSFVSAAGLPPTSMTVDHRLVYWSNASEGRIYSVVKASDNSMMASLVGGVSSINATGVRNIAAVGSHLQPYPVVHCLTPKQTTAVPQLVNRTDQTITLELPLPERERDCGNVSLATVLFTVFYGPSDASPSCLEDIKMCGKVESFDRIVTIEGLQELTEYTFFLTFSNHYSELQGSEDTLSEPVSFRTLSAEISPPQNVSVIPLSPTALRILWNPSTVEFVSYQVFWRRRVEGEVEGMYHQNGELRSESLNDNLTIKWADIFDLSPGQEYVLGVRAKTEDHRQYSNTVEMIASTFPDPEDIVLEAATATSLNVSWPKYINYSYVSSELESCYLRSQIWVPVPLHSSSSTAEFYILENLTPKTLYSFHLKITYTNVSTPYIWPSDYRFTFETLGDRPSRPGSPILHQLRGNVNQVVWDEPLTDNGAKVDMYWLEGRTDEGVREKREANFSSGERHSPNEDWVLYYNGSKPYWIMAELSSFMKYQFRVKARNTYGWSELSEPSEWFSLNRAAMLPSQELGVIVWVLTPLAVLGLILTLMCLMCTVFTKREKEKKTQQLLNMNSNIHMPGNTDVELANLRELPRRPNFVQNINALYTAADFIPTDSEIALLPHIRREHITPTKFLGSGAFGEVFEGKAKNLPGTDGRETRVAVKTLRKGASQQEQLEFLREAQLMSNFKHENILQLLGVCLDIDTFFIIMELMEGGDLLVYLRSHRPLITTESSLTLPDLLSMCVDVARGCRYLEEMHFVHRDLACRNCLVSSTDPHTRVVKIGDFGLARDIYKHDYYRKEGEGLLPVRWMAPESLVDGVFTSQSDVWAFGVLLWEIMSLGQQPYPARNNLEVLHYVRNGGRLGCPPNCCQEMYDLMLRCWSFNPEERPMFIYCLDVLMELKRKSANGQALGIPEVQETVHKKDEWRNEGEQLQTDAGGTRKYLELIYDEGYEIPRPLQQSALNDVAEKTSLTVSEDEVSSLDKLLPVTKASPYTNVVKQLSIAESLSENTISNEDIHR